MPRPKLDPGDTTARVEIKVPAAERDRWQRHARDTGDETIAHLIRRLVRQDIRRHQRSAARRDE